VQAAGCAPIVRAMAAGTPRAAFFENASTVAAGLRVPGPFADRQILRALRESCGTAVAVTDAEILEAQQQMATEEGLFAAPEGAATLAGLAHLVQQGWVRPDERVVLFNTGSGLKYLEA
jgi:threonine synthase